MHRLYDVIQSRCSLRLDKKSVNALQVKAILFQCLQTVISSERGPSTQLATLVLFDFLRQIRRVELGELLATALLYTVSHSAVFANLWSGDLFRFGLALLTPLFGFYSPFLLLSKYYFLASQSAIG